MRSKLRSLAVLVMLLPLLLTAGGCPGTDVVKVDTGDVVVVVETVNTGGSRYETAQVNLNDIGIRPTDPDASAALGVSSIGLLEGPVILDLFEGARTIATVSLHSGEYEVAGISISTLRMRDDNPFPPDGTEACVERVVNPNPFPNGDATLDTADDFRQLPDPRFNAIFVPPAVIEFADLADSAITISPGGGTLTVTIDVGKMFQAYEDSFNCFFSVTAPPTCRAGITTFASHACLNRFDAVSFQEAGSDIFSFE